MGDLKTLLSSPPAPGVFDGIIPGRQVLRKLKAAVEAARIRGLPAFPDKRLGLVSILFYPEAVRAFINGVGPELQVPVYAAKSYRFPGPVQPAVGKDERFHSLFLDRVD